MTKLSYIVSTYNSAEFLPDLFECLANQSDGRHEIVVVDSCSSDNTKEEVLSRMWGDQRIRYIRQQERTPYGVSWLLGWEIANGAIVTNSNTDDRCHPWRSVQVLDAASHSYCRDQMLRQNKHRFYYGGYETWRDGQMIAKGVPPKFSVEDFQQFFRCGPHIHWDNSIRDIVDWKRMYDAAYRLKSAFDYWMVLYFISLGVTGVNIPNAFTIYHQRPDSIEQSDKDRNSFESLSAIEEFFPDSPAILNMYKNGGDYLDRYLSFKKAELE